jgi:chromosomal replication initiation ATPase DnaA
MLQQAFAAGRLRAEASLLLEEIDEEDLEELEEETEAESEDPLAAAVDSVSGRAEGEQGGSPTTRHAAQQVTVNVQVSTPNPRSGGPRRSCAARYSGRAFGFDHQPRAGRDIGNARNLPGRSSSADCSATGTRFPVRLRGSPTRGQASMKQIALPFDELNPDRTDDCLIVTPSNAIAFAALGNSASWPGHCALAGRPCAVRAKA